MEQLFNMKHLIIEIKKEISNHSFDYLALTTAGILFLVLLKTFSMERSSMFIIVLVFCSFYIIWGTYHHSLSKTLHLKNIMEYILIGFLMLFIIGALIV